MKKLIDYARYVWKKFGAEWMLTNMNKDYDPEFRDCDNFAFFFKGFTDGLPFWGATPRGYVESLPHAFNLFIANDSLDVYMLEFQTGQIFGPITDPEMLSLIYRPTKQLQL